MKSAKCCMHLQSVSDWNWMKVNTGQCRENLRLKSSLSSRTTPVNIKLKSLFYILKSKATMSSSRKETLKHRSANQGVLFNGKAAITLTLALSSPSHLSNKNAWNFLQKVYFRQQKCQILNLNSAMQSVSNYRHSHLFKVINTHLHCGLSALPRCTSTFQSWNQTYIFDCETTFLKLIFVEIFVFAKMHVSILRNCLCVFFFPWFASLSFQPSVVYTLSVTCIFKLHTWRYQWYTASGTHVRVTVDFPISVCRWSCLSVGKRT